ncbi:DUF541 domain-containing protein [Erythrobacter litoralis]|uniref:SIMPL domain-containing protein n=1 Tax=Erythrobacter litoralis TaxID=39960 RepID=UPI0024351979|nr:SIMPL domain-containing protein [Erythrobacter litoralis]MDG6078971.1 DUF541 domain-containing protein [Erythrobacter litoralis]
MDWRTGVIFGALLLAGCADRADEARGVDHGETLLSVSASGQAESRPDRAEFEAGVETWARSARQASEDNREKIAEIVAALREYGVGDDDIQTRSVQVRRIDYGDRKGQFLASNIVAVTMDEPARAGEAVSAVTDAGANIVSGPNLSMTDPEATANLAYADAYRAAMGRAEAYAKAADMTVSRVLYIRDAGGMQGQTYLRGAEAMEEGSMVRAQAAAPPPVAAPPPDDASPGVMVGTTRSDVYIQVDFALKPA